jgi:signal transduction histidine kinase
MRSYAIACASVVVTIAAGLVIQQFVPTNPIAFLMFVPPILVTAMWTDLRASLLAAGLGGLSAAFFFRAPYFVLPKQQAEVVPLLLYLVIAGGVSVLAHRLAKARTDAQEANRLKDEFLASLSHELRTPLNALLGWIQLLRSGQLSEAKRGRALDAIERSAELQARLTADLLDVSAAMTGKLRLQRELVDVGALVEGVVESMRGAAEEKGLHLQATIGQVGEMAVDPSRLQQILANLLSNAIKFTPTGGRIETAVSEAGGGLCLVVADTGAGIPPEFLPFVFDRFRQADAGPTREHAGLGLGLAIVRHLVELHGGTVEASSQAGKGATFTVRLPRVEAATGPSSG